MALSALDHFKRVNDNFGHGCGDEVLKAVARLLKQSIRVNDEIARVDCRDNRIQVTASFGVSARQYTEQLIAESDRYLYEAKEAGRNHACSADESAPAEMGQG